MSQRNMGCHLAQKRMYNRRTKSKGERENKKEIILKEIAVKNNNMQS